MNLTISKSILYERTTKDHWNKVCTFGTFEFLILYWILGIWNLEFPSCLKTLGVPFDCLNNVR